MNARLLTLGVLHRGDFHPYEIKRRLQAAMVECYIDVDVGTLYYAVRQLEKNGLIEAVAQERVARGGMRTIYRITAKGRAEFRRGLHEQFEGEGPVSKQLYAALLFLQLADLAVVERALPERIERLDELIAKLGPIQGQPYPCPLDWRRLPAPAISTASASSTEQWLQELLAEIEKRGIRDVADPSKLGTAS